MLAGGVSFGERLRRARLELGFSQSELEDRSGIPKARLSRYENDHVLPSIGTLRRLAGALGVSEASLLGEQREIAEEFLHALMSRGVALPTAERARRLAGALADIYEALALGVPAEGSLEVAPVAGIEVAQSPDGSPVAPA